MSDKHTTVAQLRKLAQRTKTEIDKVDRKVTAAEESIAAVDGKVTTLSGRVDELVTAGGEPNIITAVKNNGTALDITDKAVDIGSSIAAAVAAADHLSRKKVANLSEIDPDAEGAEKFIYMVSKTGSDEDDDMYDEYMVLDGKIEHVGNTKVDITGKVDKVEGMGLSSNDYTHEEKAKLAGIEMATDTEVDAMLAEIFGAETQA